MVIATGNTPEFVGLNTGEAPRAILPNPATLFAKRAARFRGLAPDHALQPFLAFMGIVAESQQRLVATIAAPTLNTAEVDRALEHGMPPLPQAFAAEPGAATLLAALIADLSATTLEDGPKGAVERLGAMTPDARVALMVSVAEGAFPIETLAEAAIVAAALQVWFACAAAGLDATGLKDSEDGLCPVCASAPVASMVVSWPEAPGSRYLCCSLCCTAWNYVRVKCSNCASTKGISYRRIKDLQEDWAAEVCETCGGYAKHLIQQNAPLIDPFADDIASYGLDVLLRDEGWRRTSMNPFFIG